jgi:hypothetical protein
VKVCKRLESSKHGAEFSELGELSYVLNLGRANVGGSLTNRAKVSRLTNNDQRNPNAKNSEKFANSASRTEFNTNSDSENSANSD